MVSDGEIVDGQFSIDCVFWYFEDCGMYAGSRMVIVLDLHHTKVLYVI